MLDSKRDPPSKLTQHVMRNFGFEWKEYARFGWDDPDYDIGREQRVFHLKSQLTPDDLEGRLVLDAGCGNGRYAHWAAKCGGRVIGVDVSEAVEPAAQNTADLPNVQIVQADLFNLPFAEGTFDAVFSIGVLMQTGDARRAFRSLVRVLRPDGNLAVHVYGKGNVFYEAIDRVLRMWTTRMSLASLQRFTARAYRLRGGLLRVGLIRIVGKIVRLDAHPHCIFDWYAAPVATHHSYSEVKGWFAENGLEVKRTRETPLSWAGRARQALLGGPGTVSVLGRLVQAPPQ
jgi:SAM-dependent methyltransferase